MARVRGDGALDGGGIEVERDGVDFSEDGRCARLEHALATATKAKEGRMTSSPAPTPSVSSARCRPAVPELTATACVDAVIGGEFRFEGSSSGPRLRAACAERR